MCGTKMEGVWSGRLWCAVDGEDTGTGRGLDSGKGGWIQGDAR